VRGFGFVAARSACMGREQGQALPLHQNAKLNQHNLAAS